MTSQIIGNIISALSASITIIIIFHFKLREKQKTINRLEDDFFKHMSRTEQSLRDYIKKLKEPKPVLKGEIKTLSDVGEAVKITEEQISDILTTLHKNFPAEMTPLIDEIKVIPVQSMYVRLGYYVKITFKF